jgi:hypothetical protein
MRSLNPWPIFPPNLDPPIARSLSIQFILQGVIDSFELLDHLEKVTPKQPQPMHFKEQTALISKELEKFFLFSLENPFSQKRSLLDKLCFYCEILLQASHVSENEIPVILEEMRNSILKVKAQIFSYKKGWVAFDPLFHLYTSLYDDLCRFFSALCPYLKEARSDENVLIYLIENREKFNAHLGMRRIEELLQSFFPSGHAQLRAAIYEGYTRRGFTTFLSSVEPLIDAIEWETPCHSTAMH